MIVCDSCVHRSVEYQPIVRYDTVGGYLNITALANLLIAGENGP